MLKTNLFLFGNLLILIFAIKINGMQQELYEDPSAMTAFYLNDEMRINMNKMLHNQRVHVNFRMNEPFVIACCRVSAKLSDDEKESMRKIALDINPDATQEQVEEIIEGFGSDKVNTAILPVSLFHGKKNGDMTDIGFVINNKKGNDFGRYVNRCMINYRDQVGFIPSSPVKSQSQRQLAMKHQIIDVNDDGELIHGRLGWKSRDKFIMATTTPGKNNITNNRLAD